MKKIVKIVGWTIGVAACACLALLLICNKFVVNNAKGNGGKEPLDERKAKEEIICSCPPTIYLQPVNGFTQKEAEALVPKINKIIEESAGIELDVVALPPIRLADSLKNDAKTRYRADKIIRSIEDNHHDAVIVLTHEDISCTYKGRKDWGVLGLTLYPKHVCVASDYRLKNKKNDLWKVAAHEFFHSFCALNHCKDDNPECIMKDAKGKADFSNKEHLCKTCKSKCKI